MLEKASITEITKRNMLQPTSRWIAIKAIPRLISRSALLVIDDKNRWGGTRRANSKESEETFRRFLANRHGMYLRSHSCRTLQEVENRDLEKTRTVELFWKSI